MEGGREGECPVDHGLILTTPPCPPSPPPSLPSFRLIEDLGFNKGWVRGVTYAVFSIIAFVPRPSKEGGREGGRESALLTTA